MGTKQECVKILYHEDIYDLKFYFQYVSFQIFDVWTEISFFSSYLNFANAVVISSVNSMITVLL
jgi:hypothetical protein